MFRGSVATANTSADAVEARLGWGETSLNTNQRIRTHGQCVRQQQVRGSDRGIPEEGDARFHIRFFQDVDRDGRNRWNTGGDAHREVLTGEGDCDEPFRDAVFERVPGTRQSGFDYSANVVRRAFGTAYIVVLR